MVVVGSGEGAPIKALTRPEQVSAILIERQALFAAALSRLLSVSFSVGAQVTSVLHSDQALQLVETIGPDLLLCDVRAEPTSGVELTRQLRAAGNQTPVILLGEACDEGQLIEGLRAGCQGVFEKTCTEREFIDGVTVVLAGNRAIDDKLATRLLLAPLNGSLGMAGSIASQLSSTEFAVLSMIGGAKSVAVIAAERGISEKTVRNHLANIYRKLQLRNRPEAVLLATRMGLTDATTEVQVVASAVAGLM